MLRSVRDLEKLRVFAADGVQSGRLKDVYLDDRTWSIKYLVLALDARQFGATQVLLSPSLITLSPADQLSIRLIVGARELCSLPPAGSVLPVCKQYASIALSTPRDVRMSAADPHLRSARAVSNYCINVSGEFGGFLSDFIFEDGSWDIRYLAVEQMIEQRKVLFHVLPQSVERFTWATQRVILRALQPVEMAAEQREARVAA